MSKNKRKHSKNTEKDKAMNHDHEHEHEHHHGEHCGCGHDHEHEHEHHHGEHCGCGHDHEHEHEHHHGEHCGCGHNHEHDHDHSEKNADGCDKKLVFKLDELDCPHCASQIEAELERTEGVEVAEINLVTQQLTIGLAKSFKGDAYKEAVRAVKRFEPEVNVIDESGEEGGESASLMKKLMSEKAVIVRFIVGAALYATGMCLSYFGGAHVYVYLPVLVAAYAVLGIDVVVGAVRGIFGGRVFDERFLMTVSTVGAFAIGEYPEAVAVMLFYQIGEFFQSLAVKRSRRSISDLMDIRPDSANVLRGGKTIVVSPEGVKVGETIVVKPGERIPLDGVIIDGETALDTRALTGESLPRSAAVGDEVLSGCINESGVIKVRVEKPFGESTASKILDLVENAAGRKAPTENFISVFARYYTPAVVIMAVLLAVVPPLVLGGGWAQWVRRCFVFLVVSCPCALVISIPLTFFGGIGAASKRGVLVKGGNYLEALNYVDTVVFDKTGTLTKGEFKVTKLISEEGVTEDELLRLAAAAEKLSNHPIARSITSAFPGAGELDVKNYKELAGGGVSAELDGEKLCAGSARLMKEQGISVNEVGDAGTIVYISKDKKPLGAVVIADSPKPDSRDTIGRLKELGIKKTLMLTGDVETAAKAAADEIGVDEYHAGLLPADKVGIVEGLLDSEGKRKVAFVGDGINDAPVLARADVGIAMGALGSDAAIEAADIVLMNDEPSSIAEAVKVAKYTKHIVTQNIVLVLIVKAVILALGALGIAGMWEAVFGDVGVMVLAVLNSMRILRKK